MSMMNQEAEELIAATARAVAVELAKSITAAQLEFRTLEALAAAQDIPICIVYFDCDQGRGPKTFNIGDRVCCSMEDWHAWMRNFAKTSS